MNIKTIETICKEARKASRRTATLLPSQKSGALFKMADRLQADKEILFAANRLDMEAAKENGLTGAMQDRLLLSEERINQMADGLREVASLPDPVGEVTEMKKRPNGMMVGRMRVPLGVVGIIYESRPNVTADTAALCLKSGNAVILRGGSEAIHSNKAIALILSESATSAGVPENAIQLVPTTDRKAVGELLKMDKYIDVIIPRGGYELIRFVAENSLIPVVKHDKGVCHVYVDKFAQIKMAVEIAFNAKVQRPGVCNAMETLLIHKDIAGEFLPQIAERFKSAKVEMWGCEKSRAISGDIKPASDADWDEEYLDLIIAIKIVDSMDDAMDHIAEHGSNHTDTIVTNDYKSAQKFLSCVDSASVMVNVSTRVSDGDQFGLGAEVGISNQKLHVRGPMGINDLTSLKYIVYGNGHLRE